MIKMRKATTILLIISVMIGIILASCVYGKINPIQNESLNNELYPSSYPIIETGQTKCYDNEKEIAPPQQGQPFYGQDAQYQGIQPSYTLSADGLTVYDNNTDLTWQHSPDTNGDGYITYSDKLTHTQAQAYPAKLNAASYGGYSDWRLPTIKELYSLIKFNGTDPSGMTGNDTSGLTPFIDTNYFKFSYGFTDNGERTIDSQWATSTLYVANSNKMFGVNFADGRIKAYGTSMPGRPDKPFFVICVRGNPNYGKNDFRDNGDGTITDRATGLMWSKADSGKGMNWESALAWVQQKNAEKYLGHNDWRLPNAKELQSIVDYTRSPNTTRSAAIDPVFTCTSITNEAGQADYPFYWTGTTHASSIGSGGAGVYVAFGRAMGYMNNQWEDVHGAGAQRSDPKEGNPADYPQGRGPQGDAIRIYNYVRLVRGESVKEIGEEKTILRLAGEDRYQTAVEISKNGWNTSETVIVTRGDLFPDALAGGSLAGKYNSPILLTWTSELHPSTKEEMVRLKAKSAIILGSENAVSKNVEESIRALGITNITRIGGDDRYDTAGLIAKALDSTGEKTALIATGENFPDALSSASYAYFKRIPLFLVGNDKISPEIQQAFSTLSIKKVIPVGGTDVVPDGYVNWFVQKGATVETRLSGDDRYGTAKAIADYGVSKGMSASKVYLVTGENFPDALACAPLAGKNNSVILLTSNTLLRRQVKEWITSNKTNINFVYIAGGPDVVSDGVKDEIWGVIK